MSGLSCLALIYLEKQNKIDRMAITNTQQARQMYNKGSKKPVTQAGVN